MATDKRLRLSTSPSIPLLFYSFKVHVKWDICEKFCTEDKLSIIINALSIIVKRKHENIYSAAQVKVKVEGGWGTTGKVRLTRFDTER